MKTYDEYVCAAITGLLSQPVNRKPEDIAILAHNFAQSCYDERKKRNLSGKE